MLLGIGSFAGFPFSTAGSDNSVAFVCTANTLAISIGNPGITADAIIEDPTGSQVTLGTGTVTISTDANVTAVKNELTLGTGTVTVTAGATLDETS